MLKLMAWEYAMKLWMWNHFGWWLIAFPFVLYGLFALYIFARVKWGRG